MARRVQIETDIYEAHHGKPRGLGTYAFRLFDHGQLFETQVTGSWSQAQAIMQRTARIDGYQRIILCP
jgi:hypothetical protein